MNDLDNQIREARGSETVRGGSMSQGNRLLPIELKAEPGEAELPTKGLSDSEGPTNSSPVKQQWKPTRRIWPLVIVPAVRRAGARYQASKGTSADTETSAAVEPGMRSISPAFLQVKDQLKNSEPYRCLRLEIGRYCNVETPANLSASEVQNLAYSVAGARAANAFTFSFRADLCNGMFVAFSVGTVFTLFEYGNRSWKEWVVTSLVYAVMALGFAVRAWLYFDIRGRIIYPIGLAVLAERRNRNGK